jgi:hypothetical protein
MQARCWSLHTLQLFDGSARAEKLAHDKLNSASAAMAKLRIEHFPCV